MKIKHLLLTFAVLCGLFTAVNNSFAQGTTFTYQGLLGNSNNLVTGSYDFTFKLFNALSGPAQVGPTVTNIGVGVTNGLFITSMDFGAQFNGTPYWLEIGVRTNGGGGFTTLTPREALTPTPYSITAENLDGFLSSSQLTGTLPAGVLAGVNGGGLTSLNASSLTSGTVPDARLSSNVALLNANQTFLKTNTFNSSFSGGRFILQGNGIDTNLFTGFSLQYDAGEGEGALVPSYNDGFAELGFYTKAGGGQPVARTMLLDWYGGLRLDQVNSNNGVLNNGTQAGAGLTFGIGSGEGIASKRTAGGDQFGLDFYTGFSNRMSILNNGFVGIGRQTQVSGSELFGLFSPVTNTWGGMYIETGTGGRPFYGYENGNTAWTELDGTDGNKWKLYNSGYWLTVTSSGNVGIGGNMAPVAKLDIGGTAGTDGIRFPDGSVQTTAPTNSFSSGYGTDPTATNNFIGPTTSVTITSTSQRVLVTANKALGSTVGAANLNLYIGYRLSGSVAAPVLVGGGSLGQTVPAGIRIPMGLSGIITGLPPGTYDVGLAGTANTVLDAGHWNNNEWGYVTAVIF